MKIDYLISFLKELQNSRILFFAVCFTFTISSKSQETSVDSYTNRAALSCQEKQYEKAIQLSDSAIISKEVSDPYTWYVRGFIFKEAYKNGISGAIDYRELASQSLLKCKQLQAGSDAYNPNFVLKYLATTCYNDALITANQAIDGRQTESDRYFEQYIFLMSKVDSNYTNESAAAEYYITKAQRQYSLWSENSCEFDLLKACEESYQTALKFEPTNCDCLYNLSIASYNRGLMQKQSDAIKSECHDEMSMASCFENSLVWLQKTEQNCPDRQDVCQAFLNANKALGNQEEVLKYTQKLEAIKQLKQTGK